MCWKWDVIDCPLTKLKPSEVPLTSSRSLTASVFPHRAASCRAVPALVCLLMSIPAWISSLTAGERERESGRMEIQREMTRWEGGDRCQREHRCRHDRSRFKITGSVCSFNSCYSNRYNSASARGLFSAADWHIFGELLTFTAARQCVGSTQWGKMSSAALDLSEITD